ncbi:MAG: lysophospholipid acyltransferase family protein [Bacillota bacterium]
MGTAALPASVFFGLVYARLGPFVAFGYAAALAFATLLVLVFQGPGVAKRKKKPLRPSFGRRWRFLVEYLGGAGFLGLGADMPPEGGGKLHPACREGLLWLVRHLFPRPEICGLHHLDPYAPAILVANHLGSFAPVVLSAHFPYPFSPWVTHEVTDPTLCPAHLLKDFVRPELGLDGPAGEFVARVLGRVCVAVMREIGAIPVYRKSKKLRLTVEKSVERLAAGGRVLVFPEVQNTLWDETVNEFHTGFVNIARSLYRRTGAVVKFYPVCVHRKKNLILIGEGVAFAPERPFGLEKKRIVEYLEESIRRMYHAAEAVSPAEAPSFSAP